jgi:hypothetical protein
MSEQLDYLLAVLDLELVSGADPLEAIRRAVKSYAYVYHDIDHWAEAEASAEGRMPEGEGNE